MNALLQFVCLFTLFIFKCGFSHLIFFPKKKLECKMMIEKEFWNNVSVSREMHVYLFPDHYMLRRKPF